MVTRKWERALQVRRAREEWERIEREQAERLIAWGIPVNPPASTPTVAEILSREA